MNTELWVSLVVDMILNVWLFMVMLVCHNWDIMDICMVAVLVNDIMMLVVLIMMIIVMVLIIVVRGLMVFNVVMSWLMDILMSGLSIGVVDWLKVFLVMNWAVVN